MAAEAKGATELGRSHSFSHSIKSHLTRRFSKKHKRSNSAMSATATTTDSVNPNPILRVNNTNAYCRQFHRPVPQGQANSSQPARSSLLNAPPMTKVWLDDESDSDASDNEAAGDETKKLKPLREPKITLPTSLRRLGSNKKKQQSVDLNAQRSNSSLSHHKPSHSRSNSATSRLFNFLSQKPTPPPKISAPTNFVHHRHIDADYLRGSNTDKYLSRSLSLQQKQQSQPAAIPEHDVQVQRTDSQRQFNNNTNSSSNNNRSSHYHQHRHEDSSSSGATTTTGSTFSRPTSALSSSTSLNPSPMFRHKNDPRVLDKKSSVESFASWGAASSNADFLEQQKWLLNSTTPDQSQQHQHHVDSYGEHSLDSYTRYQKSPYSCYYSSSTTTIPQPKRKSTLLPSPSLPVTETDDVPISEPPPVNLDSLSYGPPLTSIVAGNSNIYSFTPTSAQILNQRKPQTNPPI